MLGHASLPLWYTTGITWHSCLVLAHLPRGATCAMSGWPWHSTLWNRLHWLGLLMSPTEKTIVSLWCFILNHFQFLKFHFVSFTAIHEKIFIVFMFSSQAHMLIVLKILKMAQFGGQQPAERRSYFFKRWLFLLSLLFTFGLCIFFVKHRIYCHDMGIYFNSFPNSIYCFPLPHWKKNDFEK